MWIKCENGALVNVGRIIAAIMTSEQDENADKPYAWVVAMAGFCMDVQITKHYRTRRSARLAYERFLGTLSAAIRAGDAGIVEVHR
jgi:hypothetical protein